jgi:hypothetical protein
MTCSLNPDTIKCYEATGYGPDVELEEGQEPRKVRMAEYIVTVQIPVLIPKYEASPGVERDNAEELAKIFLQQGFGNADLVKRGDIDNEFEFLEPEDPCEVDMKHIGIVSVEPYTNPFNNRAIYREEHS